MGFNILIIYFFIYSVLGWFCETIYCTIQQKKFVNSGFMAGPYCPIYGFGGLIVVMLSRFDDNPVIMFLLAMIFTSILEYITSYIMEKSFGATWWDYSHLPFNINGRVCLLYSTLFGIMSILLTYLLQPQVFKLVGYIPHNCISYVVLAIVVVLSIDFVTSINTVLNFKEKLRNFENLTEIIKEKQKSKIENLEIINQLEEIKENTFNKFNLFHKRILSAFPDLDFKKIGLQIDEIKEHIFKKNCKYDEKNTKN